MKVKAIYMLNDYSWNKFEKKVSTIKEAKMLSDEISAKLNKAINSGKIKDYRVEY